MKKYLTILLKGSSAVLFSLLLLGFVGISSASASNTPLVKCDYEGATPLICSNATATVSSIDTGSPINGLASAYATWNGGITQRIDFNNPLTVATSGFAVAFRFKRADAGWWLSGGIRLNDDTILQFSNSDGGKLMQNTEDYWWPENGWGTYDLDYYWVIGNYTPTGVTYYNNNLLWASPWHGRGTWLTQDFTTNKPKNFEFYSGNAPVLYDDFQVFDHILSETERQQLVDTGNITPPEPPSNSYIMYYGIDPAYSIVGQPQNLQVVYNICDEWSDNSNFYIQLRATSTESNLANPQKLWNCSGSTNYTQTASTTELSEYAHFIIYDNATPTTTITTSEQFLYSTYTPLAEENNWIISNLENPTYINIDNMPTTTARVSYRIFYDNIASTSICMINKEGNLKTDYCANTITEGLNWVNIDIPSQTFENTILSSFGLYDGNSLLLESDPIMLTFYSETNSAEKWNSQFSATGTIAFLGLNSRDLACSEESWTSTSTYLGINFTKSLCEIKKFALDIAFISGITAQKAITNIGDTLGNTFPFGIYKNILDSWNESENQPIPEDLAWLIPINTNGDITLNLPPNLTNGTSTEIIIFGKTIFEQEGTPADQMFKNIRALSTYLLWAGFLIGLSYLATDVYIEIKQEKTK